jgi:hypothetical protein
MHKPMTQIANPSKQYWRTSFDQAMDMPFTSAAIKETELLTSTAAYATALTEMFQYTEKLFQDFPDLELETFEQERKILVRWGQTYDVEQLMEHAIVHILRHRRQIERFLGAELNN